MRQYHISQFTYTKNQHKYSYLDVLLLRLKLGYLVKNILFKENVKKALYSFIQFICFISNSVTKYNLGENIKVKGKITGCRALQTVLSALTWSLGLY